MSSAKDRALVRVELAQGKHPDEIAAFLGWPMDRVNEIVGELLDEAERDVVSRRPESWFTEYVMRTHGNLRALDELDADLKTSAQGSARVGVINARQKLLTDVIKVGQEMGFIRKRGGGDRLTVVFGGMEDGDLRRVMLEEVRGLRELVIKHGDRDFLDGDPGGEPQGAPVAPTPLRPATAPARPAPEPLEAPGEPEGGDEGQEPEAAPWATPGLAPGGGAVIRRKVSVGSRGKRAP